MTWQRWLPTFLAFPIAGYLTIETIGSVDDPLTAAAGGAVAGAVLGAAQWLALRSEGITRRWIAASSVALAVGSALAAVITGAGTELQDLMVAGLIAGAALGAVQGHLLGRGTRTAASWAGVTALAWSLGWLTTTSAGIDVERGYIVFGSSGAILATVLTGLALRQMQGAPATA